MSGVKILYLWPALTVLLVLASACGGSMRGPPTQVAPAQASATVPSVLATTNASLPTPLPLDQVLFRSDTLSLQFSYPRRLDQVQFAACRPVAVAGSITMGGNILIAASPAASMTIDGAVDVFLDRSGAREEGRTATTVGTLDAVRIEYRLQASSRFGIATFTRRGGSIYTFVFEGRPSADSDRQCGESTPTELYNGLLQSVRFLD